MQENKLFEYAVIRIVPRVEREEFINIGVIVFCAEEKFLSCAYNIDRTKLSAFSNKIIIEDIIAYMLAFENICNGNTACGPIGKLPIKERFRWLTANRSTIIQTSKMHPGLCTNAQEKLAYLFEKLVL